MAQPEQTGRVTRLLGRICSHCPICRHARARPESLIGRVLHHPLHADHCPFWKAEKALADTPPPEER